MPSFLLSVSPNGILSNPLRLGVDITVFLSLLTMDGNPIATAFIESDALYLFI